MTCIFASKVRTIALSGMAVLAVLASACGNAAVLPATPVQTQTILPPTLAHTPAPTASQTPSSTPRPTITIPPTNTTSPSLTPFTPSPQRSRVEFKASDGQSLVGYFYPTWKPNAPVVILMHQRQANQATWDESGIIPWLQNWPVESPLGARPTPSADGKLPALPGRLSFAVFTFDFRGHGESQPLLTPETEQNNFSFFLQDAKAAYRVIHQMPRVNSKRIIGIGTSIGADAVVDACGDDCAGAFSISPGNWLGVDYGQAVNNLLAQGKIARCMYAVNDGPSPARCLSVTPNENYEIFSYPGIKHGMTFFVPRKMEADFGINILEFLQAAIREKP